jgi:Tol biopolymer transport system component
MNGRIAMIRLSSRQLALVIVSALVLFALAAPGAQATFRGHGTRIAWAYDAADPNYHVSPDYAIQTVSSRGGAIRTIVHCHTNENPTCSEYGHVSYSPDGRKLAWAVTDSTGTTQIVVANADGSSPTAIPNVGESDFEPSFSPRGNRLVYVRMLTGASTGQVVTSDLTGADVRVLATVPTVTTVPGVTPLAGVDPAWAPNGRNILYTNGHSLWIVGAGGRGAHRLIRDGLRADWAPSGRQIAYIASNGSIRVARADGTGQHRLRVAVPLSATPPISIYYVVFSPDGTRIAFAGENSRMNPVLFVVSAHGGRARLVDWFDTGDEGLSEPGAVGLSWQP